MVQRCSHGSSCPHLLLLFVMLLALLPLAASANPIQDILIKATSLANAGDTEGARVLYQQLIDDHGGTVFGGHAYLGMAKLHVKANENDEALAAFDEALAYPFPTLQSRAALEKVALLGNRFQNYEEGIAVAEQYLTELGELMPPYDRRLMIVQLAYCYDKSGQPEDAVAVYEQEVLATPALLFASIYYERLFALHTGLGNQDAALSIARAGYAVCEFDQASIEAMSNLVKKAYAGRGEIFKATQFFASQEDPEVTNPLLEAPMPEVTEDQLNTMLLACGTDGRLVVGAYLYAGNYREAMIAAQDYMSEAPAAEMVKALGQVARVFKAKDLNLVRGNQFLEYAKTGEGDNPLSAFWDEVTE